MADKICSACKLPKPLAEFNTDNSRADKKTTRCKDCISDSRSADAREEKKAIALHKKHLLACQCALDDPDASDLKRRNAERDIRLAGKHLERILKPFNDKRQAAIDADRQAKAAITRAQQAEADRIADAEYYARKAEEERLAAIVKAAQDADALAATTAAIEILDWVKKYLLMPHLELKARERLRLHCLEQSAKCAASAKKAAGREQLVLNRMAQTFQMLADRLVIVTEEFLMKKPPAYFETACVAVNWDFRTSQEQALLRHFTVWTLRSGGFSRVPLPDAPPPILNDAPPPNSLENLSEQDLAGHTTLEWREQEEKKRQAKLEKLRTGNKEERKEYEALSKDESLHIKGGSLLAIEQRKILREYAERYPEESAKRALDALKPRDVSARTVVYLVPVWTHANPHARDEKYWPHGERVSAGQITYDARIKAWCRVPGPASMDSDFGDSKPSGPTEEQLARMDPATAEWHRDRAADGDEWVQDSSGGWVKKKSGTSPWQKPERITFLRGDRHIEGIGKDHFRQGYWWDAASIERAESTSGDLNKIPAPILARLPKIQKADFIAKERPDPAKAALLDAPPLTPWQRHELKMQRQKERDAEILSN